MSGPRQTLVVDLSTLPRQAFAAPPPDKPDPFTAATLEQAKLHEANLRNRGLSHDLDARKTYANRAFWLVVLWLVWMMTIVLFQGFGGTGNPEISGQLFGLSYTFKEPRWFSLSDSVLIALISGTTISVFGFFAAVMNYLFPKRKD